MNVKVFFIYLLLLQPISGSIQINFALTNLQEDKSNYRLFQHDCLYVDAFSDDQNGPFHIIAYCMNAWPSNWNTLLNRNYQTFSFEDLGQRNITSRQLYLWSAPIDLAEDYQFYLDQLSDSSGILATTQLFYNCTWPQFGPFCQYMFDDYESYQSLTEFIRHVYATEYRPTTLTCYTLLQCNRGSTNLCLDWSDICNGKFDCIDGTQDEENCWQLEINVCRDYEYRCINGQCVPEAFFRDDPNIPDCLDGSDEKEKRTPTHDYCDTAAPTFGCEDLACTMKPYNELNPLSSSCVSGRNKFLIKQLILKPNSTSDLCWSMFLCALHLSFYIENQTCFEFYENGNYANQLQQICPESIDIPADHNLLGGLYSIYMTNELWYLPFGAMPPKYVCFNEHQCAGLLTPIKLSWINNSVCYDFLDISRFTFQADGQWTSQYLQPIVMTQWVCHRIVNSSFELCSRPNMFQCKNFSKCISGYRLNDFITDCYYRDDELFDPDEIIRFNYSFGKCFKCEEKNICIEYRFVEDGHCHCFSMSKGFCEDEALDLVIRKTHVSFQTICDGFIELAAITLSGKNETDETECDEWQCVNSYTRCDGYWNCLNGADEVDCDPSPLLDCPKRHHLCVSFQSKKLMCLPIANAHDGKIDCIGATDEPTRCRSQDHWPNIGNFYCKNEIWNSCHQNTDLCDGATNCLDNEDERFCNNNTYFSLSNSLCTNEYMSIRSDVEKFFCGRPSDMKKQTKVHFSLTGATPLNMSETNNDEKPEIQRSSNIQKQQHCHRGVSLQVLSNVKNSSVTSVCLCSPSYYGDSCQYQNQRVSLTMQFRSLSDAWRTPFALIVSLIDDSNERIIHSYEKFTYLPMRDCQRKYHVYLLYSIRPKDNSKNYSIHIDIYEKISLIYRGSFLLSIDFPFLPVNRLSVQLNLSYNQAMFDGCAGHRCVHGQCVKYLNSLNGARFCRCHQGWSGYDCTIPHPCTCWPHSICIGASADNRSICVCPMDRFGPRCLLRNRIDKLNGTDLCFNDGQFVLQAEYGNKYSCICPRGFSGERCEIVDTKISISFEKGMRLSQSMLIHFRVIPPEIASRSGDLVRIC